MKLLLQVVNISFLNQIQLTTYLTCMVNKTNTLEVHGDWTKIRNLNATSDIVFIYVLKNYFIMVDCICIIYVNLKIRTNLIILFHSYCVIENFTDWSRIKKYATQGKFVTYICYIILNFFSFNSVPDFMLFLLHS